MVILKIDPPYLVTLPTVRELLRPSWLTAAPVITMAEKAEEETPLALDRPTGLSEIARHSSPRT